MLMTPGTASSVPAPHPSQTVRTGPVNAIGADEGSGFASQTSAAGLLPNLTYREDTTRYTPHWCRGHNDTLRYMPLQSPNQQITLTTQTRLPCMVQPHKFHGTATHVSRHSPRHSHTSLMAQPCKSQAWTDSTVGEL